MVIQVALKKKRRTAQSTGIDASAFAVVLEDLHAKFDVFGEALQLVRGDVAGLREDVNGLKQDMAETRADVRVLREDVNVLKQDMAETRADVKVLREDVNVLRHDVGVLRQDVDLLKVAVIDNSREIKQLRKAR